MKASAEIKDWVMKWEGLRLSAYKCDGGVWTIGYGHTAGVKQGQVITAAKARELFEADIMAKEIELNAALHSAGIILDKQGRFDALLSFAFNLGMGNLRNSTLWKKIKANVNDPTIADEFGRWVFAKGVRLPGLEKRRALESKFWQR